MINLLPPPYKQELQREEKYRLILILGAVFLIFLISLTLILFTVQIYVQTRAESLRAQAKVNEEAFGASEVEQLRNQIISANRQIAQVQKFYQDNPGLTASFEGIFAALPSEIRLTSFAWRKDTDNVTISGFSPSRETLFNLKNVLEAKKEFSEINFPAQNWFKPKDIDFQVSFKLNL